MSDFSICDLRHLLPQDPTAERPARVLRLEEFLGRIAQAASVRTSGAASATAVRCRRRPGHKPCKGRIEVLRHDIPPEVQWSCPACGDGGIVTGWQGTHWDLSRAPPSHPGADPEGERPVETVLAQKEYELIRDSVLTLEATSDRIIAGARPAGSNRVLMTGRLDDWEFLIGEVAAEANHAEDPRIQRRLDELVVRLDMAMR